jgi:Domain of unknown function (DUF4160)
MSIIGIVDAAKLYMYPNDHPPPHFHVLFAEYRAVIDIRTMKLSRGDLPKAKLRAIIKWAKARRVELLEAWNVTQQSLVPEKIL